MDRPAKRAKLLSDDSSSDESEQNIAAAGTSGFKVNEEYARRFEHNKKREERHRLEEKYKDSRRSRGSARQDEAEEEDEDSEDEESEDDDGELATIDVDDEIFATLNAIKSKDPRVYDKSVQFYKDFDVEVEQANKATKAEKPLYLQDYHRQNLMAGYAGEQGLDTETVPRTYDEEQDAIRRELVNSMHATTNGNISESDDGSDQDDFLVTKSKVKNEGSSPATKRAPHITEEDVVAADKDPETYLSNFMAARAWVPNETSRWKAFDSDDSDDEKRADEFEEAYNMRFEDPATANEKLQSFARDVGKYGVRRSEKTGRQKARDRERELREAAKVEREEERARLRKLKIEEAEEKVQKIKHAAGLRGQELDISQWRDIIDGDFDDATWEAEMGRRFGADYYAQDGSEGEGENEDEDTLGSTKRRLHKPKWDDDININDLVPDFEEDDGKPAFTLSSDDEDAGAASPIEMAAEDEESGDHGSHKKSQTKKDRLKEKAEAKRTARRERRQIESLVDATLPLSHPSLTPSNNDTSVGGFRYRDTSPLTFGLTTRDILFADDSQLNQYAGLKKMAAFRDAEKKRRDKKRYSKKGRLREWRKETFGSVDGPRDPVQEGSGGALGEGTDRKSSKDAEVGNVRDGERKRKRKKNKKKDKMVEGKA